MVDGSASKPALSRRMARTYNSTCSPQTDLLALDGHWGYCSPACEGELPTYSRSATSNMSDSFLAPPAPTRSPPSPTCGPSPSPTSPPGDQVHPSALLSFFSFPPIFVSPGICYTYDPPKEVEPGVSGQLYALLGDQSVS